MLKGSLHIGDRSIPMRHHFLTELMKATHLEVNTDGELRSPLDPRWPDQKVELRAFEARSPYDGSRVSSLAAPFPLRIEEPTYIVELTSLLDFDFVDDLIHAEDIPGVELRHLTFRLRW